MDLGYSNRVDPLPYITSDKEPISNQTQQNNVQENNQNNNNVNNTNNTNNDENKQKNTIPIQ